MGIALTKAKNSLFNVFNGIYFIQGLTATILSSIYLDKSLEYEFITNTGRGVQETLLAVGSLTILYTILALLMINTIKKNLHTFKLFLAFLIILLIMILSACVAGFVLKGQLNNDIFDSLTNLMKSYDESATYNLWLDKLHQDLHCCGATNYTDWFSLDLELCTCLDSVDILCIPKSCCKTSFTFCTYTNISQSLEDDDNVAIFTQGCVDPLLNMLTRNMDIQLGFGIAGAFINACGLILIAFKF